MAEGEEKRISTEEAFHLVGGALEEYSLIISNHSKQLANHQETLMAMGALIDMLMIKTGLKKADSGNA
jgi:hypothetical protein